MLPLRQQVDGRFAGLYNDRYSWWVHWREIAEYTLPRRYIWLVTPNKSNRGGQLSTKILDATGTLAARTCASGMMSGITSPTRPWFKLSIDGYDPADEASEVSLWLAEVVKRMSRVFAESNFYNAVAVLYFDLVVFGTGAMLIYEDFDDVIRCYNPCLGEYFLANSSKMKVDTFYREYVQTVAQVVQEFGIENCSQTVRSLYQNGGANLTREVKIRHAIEPNLGGVPSIFKFRELYWEAGTSDGDQFLRKKGFHEAPGMFPRWDISGNDAYGRGPGMDALGDTKQLQQEQLRKAQAIDKLVNPPMVADVQLKNQPASLLPGAITYVNGTASAGFKPVFQVNPPVQEIMLDIEKTQERIRQIYFNDLFMMISQLQTVRTATEIDARREEKLVMLGPVLERFENEALDPIIDRVFNVMNRAGLLPPAPPEIQDAPIQVTYVSMLAEAQKAASTAALERLGAQVGNIAAVQPDVIDTVDWDEFINEYAARLGVEPKVIRSRMALEQIRQGRAQQQALQDASLVGEPLVKGAQVLSKTDVGGGQNALAMMLGGP